MFNFNSFWYSKKILRSTTRAWNKKFRFSALGLISVKMEFKTKFLFNVIEVDCYTESSLLD